MVECFECKQCANGTHFFPALLKKIHKLKNDNKDQLVLWGNGKSRREVMHVDDLADACVFFMNKKTKSSLINICTGKDYSIKHYAELILKIIIKNKKVKIKYDKSKPNGVFRKVMDVSLAKSYGWEAKVNLKYSILNTYHSFLKEINK